MNENRWQVLSTTSLGTLLSALNFSTLIIALPELMRGLHATILQGVWILFAYMVAQTVMVLMGGSLADRFGRRRLYIVGLAVFTLFSLVAGTSPNAPELIVWRVFQGIGGALVMANSTAIVAQSFPRRELSRALGINVMVVAVGQILGPVVGGWLTTLYGWRWTFWFNVPIGIIAVAWAVWVLGWKSVRGENLPLDWAGIVTYVFAITGLLYALSVGAVSGWTTASVLIAGAVFVVGLPVWILIESRNPAPLLHLPLLRIRPFGFGSVAAALNAIARMAVIFLMIFYFQGAQGESALVAGLRLIPLAAGMLLLAPVGGAIADRFGTTRPATVGLIVSTVGFVGLALTLHLHSPYLVLGVWMAIIGVGAGIFNSPNTSRMMTAAGPTRRGEASGIRALTTNTGMMLSIALAFAVVASVVPRDAMLAIFTGTARALPNGAAVLPRFLVGIRGTFWVMAGLNVLAVFFSASGRVATSDESDSSKHQDARSLLRK
jgi:EmrB/QacA subfamily drug resistance transporter